MGRITVHPDFRDFLNLLNSRKVEYLLVGGYAVGFHGYPRATGNMDIWISVNEANALKSVAVLKDFGMPADALSKELFLDKDKKIRMGVPPVRIVIITGASGVDFEECYSRREVITVDDVPINFISLNDLKINKKAEGRYKDLDDLEHLP